VQQVRNSSELHALEPYLSNSLSDRDLSDDHGWK
jgi:hypothetical protein